MSEVYDPSEHTVDEVKSYVEEHPDECEAVLDAEQEGKDRITLVEWLEAQQNGAQSVDESPADAEGERPESEWEDPNTYPDPKNPPHTP